MIGMIWWLNLASRSDFLKIKFGQLPINSYIFNYQIKINILIQKKAFSMSWTITSFWRLQLLILMMLTEVFDCQIIKTSYNKTKAVNDELMAINQKRRIHGVIELRQDKNLCTRAQNHVTYIAGVGILFHCNQFDFRYVGQAMAYISKPPNVAYFGGEATSRWYGEGVNYDYDTGRSVNGEEVEDFTSMLWSSTTSICIAISQTYEGSGNYYVVAHFYPVPNVEGEYLNNVFRPA